jgi:hypothetical protein
MYQHLVPDTNKSSRTASDDKMPKMLIVYWVSGWLGMLLDGSVVPQTGLEPVTPSLRMMDSPDTSDKNSALVTQNDTPDRTTGSQPYRRSV